MGVTPPTTIANLLGHCDDAGNLNVNVQVGGSTPAAKTIKSLSGSFAADADIVAAVTSKRIKVVGYAFFTFGTSATVVLLKSNGTSGTLLWTVALQSQASAVMGANLAVSSPAFIFATAAGEKLTADTNQSDTIYWSISYYDDDAT
jgi:hypothetical protein